MNDSLKVTNTTGLSPLFRPLVLVVIALSILMVTLGGLVHNTDSSLACPDWPLCFGQIMPEMTGGVLIEHSHRLLGSLIGILVITLCVLARKNRSFKGRALGALALVVLQGVLGGLTVLLKISPLVSTLHLTISQIFLAWLLWIWIDASPSKSLQVEPQSYVALHQKYSFFKWATVALFFQMILGASMRHGGAGVACGVGPEASIFCLDSLSGLTSFWPTGLAAKVNLFHRIFALITTGLVIASTIPVIKFARKAGIKSLRVACVFCHVLICTQIGLGVSSLWTGMAPAPVTLHLLAACLLWLLMVGILRFIQNTFAPTFTIASENSKRV